MINNAKGRKINFCAALCIYIGETVFRFLNMEERKLLTTSELLAKVRAGIASVGFGTPDGLYAPIRYSLSAGGKRIRPVLMLLAYNMYKDDVDSIMDNALGLETYHNFTLLHDDLMDKADVRRGNPTVHVKWDANTAILSGDAMLILAYKLMCGGKALSHPDALAAFTDAALGVCEGQQYDMDFETRDDVCVDEYMEMIRLKTSVLLAGALKVGALLADAPKSDADLLYKVGENIGLAFQLQDDYLDVYGDPAVFGKNIGGDILSNKKTFMLITAMEKAEGEEKAELERLISLKTFDPQEKISAVTAIYNAVGVREICEAKISSLFSTGLKCLDAVALPEDRKSVLRSFVCGLMGRNS